MSLSRTINPYVQNVALAGGSSRVITFNGVAVMTQIRVDTSGDVWVYLNDLTDPLVVDGNSTQIFNNGDCHLTHITIANTVSGASNAMVRVLAGVVS